MQAGVEIAYHGMQPAAHVEARVHRRVERLEKVFGRIIGCRVIVDAPHHHHRQGNAYAVRLEVSVPGGTVSVDRDPGDRNAHFDVLVAIRDAFDSAERQLRRWKEKHSGRPETHAEPPRGRIQEIEADHGQIALSDGRLIYFHRNAVIGGDFDALSVGDPVILAVDQGVGEGGPHASTVRPISPRRYADGPA